MTDIKNMKQRADDSGYFVNDYIKRSDAVRTMAQYMMDMALIDNPEASDRIEEWEGDIAAPVMSTVEAADVRENVKGRWVEVVDRTEMYDKEGVKTWGMLFQCNQCGFVLNAVEGHTGQYNYCPNCGADMRGDNNGKRNDS